MRGKPATLHDVAAASGVSVPTVSKVLNGRGRVAEDTRARILAAARDLDFRPNALAQSFVRGRSQSVGILTQFAFGGFTMPVLTGAHAEFGRRSFTTLLHDEPFTDEGLDENFKQMQARRTDGVLVIGDGPGAPIRSFTEVFSGPVITVFGVSRGPADVSIIPDGYGAGRQVASHLVEVGRRRVALVTARDDDLAAHEREAGAAEILAGHGLRFCGEPLHGDWSRDWGAAAAATLLDRGDHPDAIVCGNDQIALGVASVLRRRGVRIPDDVALVGYDNDDRVFGRQDHRFLTTVDPRLGVLGATAARTLAGAIAGDEPAPGVRREPCVLLPAASTLGPTVPPADLPF